MFAQGGDQWHELRAKLGEQRPHLGGLHIGLVVIQQYVVRGLIGVEAVDVAAGELEVALKAGGERREIRSPAGLDPGVMAQRRGPGYFRRQLDWDAPGLLPPPPGYLDDPGVVGVSGGSVKILRRLLEQPAGLVGDEQLVRDPLERPH